MKGLEGPPVGGGLGPGLLGPLKSSPVIRILFSEKYVRTLTYSILAYVNMNRIRTQTIIAETGSLLLM